MARFEIHWNSVRVSSLCLCLCMCGVCVCVCVHCALFSLVSLTIWLHFYGSLNKPCGAYSFATMIPYRGSSYSKEFHLIHGCEYEKNHHLFILRLHLYVYLGPSLVYSNGACCCANHVYFHCVRAMYTTDRDGLNTSPMVPHSFDPKWLERVATR